MMTLEQLKEQNEQIFNDVVRLPKPSINFQDAAERALSLNLPIQAENYLYDKRLWQARELGLQELTPPEMVTILTGEKHHRSYRSRRRTACEYIYNPVDGIVHSDRWGGRNRVYVRYANPFKRKWIFEFGNMSNLLTKIPYGVMLRMHELKNLQLFNQFQVMAPRTAFLNEKPVDPIIVGTICRGMVAGSTFDERQFFIAQW